MKKPTKMKKVYCAECKWLNAFNREDCMNPKYQHKKDSWYGEDIFFGNSSKINKKNNCKCFEEIKYELVKIVPKKWWELKK